MQTHDQLDAAIDRVAARLVSVEPDALTVDGIRSRLPERSARWSWLPPLAAAAAVLLLAIFTFVNRSTEVVEKTATHVAASSPAAPVPAREAPREQPRDLVVAGSGREGGAVASVAPDAPAAPADDFGLKPVAGPKAIALAAIDTPAVLDVPSVELAPIVLTDLPLANESPLPR